MILTQPSLYQTRKSTKYESVVDFHYSDFWTDPGKQFKPKSLGISFTKRFSKSGWHLHRDVSKR
ncbi:glycosyl hydrolase 53 family protein [Bacillus sp. SL00103]